METVDFPWLLAAKNASDAIRQTKVKLGEDFRTWIRTLFLTVASSSLTHAADVLINAVIAEVQWGQGTLPISRQTRTLAEGEPAKFSLFSYIYKLDVASRADQQILSIGGQSCLRLLVR